MPRKPRPRHPPRLGNVNREERDGNRLDQPDVARGAVGEIRLQDCRDPGPGAQEPRRDGREADEVEHDAEGRDQAGARGAREAVDADAVAEQPKQLLGARGHVDEADAGVGEGLHGRRDADGVHARRALDCQRVEREVGQLRVGRGGRREPVERAQVELELCRVLLVHVRHDARPGIAGGHCLCGFWF